MFNLLNLVWIWEIYWCLLLYVYYYCKDVICNLRNFDLVIFFVWFLMMYVCLSYMGMFWIYCFEIFLLDENFLSWIVLLIV